MLVAMAGLPGTGKTTVAKRLQAETGGVLLSKDEIRAALFPAEFVDYTRAQDDLCVDIILRVAAYILASKKDGIVIVDGRTFSRSGDIKALFEAAEQIGTPLRIIECVCAEATALERIDQASGKHPAANRDRDLYKSLKDSAEEISAPKWVVDTGRQSPEEAMRGVLGYLGIRSFN